jgi:hypothetical protein
MKITHGGTLPDSSDKDDFYEIIDSATGTGILDADIDAGAAISDSKLATISTLGKVNVTALTGQISSANLSQIVTPGKVSGAALTLLGNIPANAGIVPAANLPGGGGAVADAVLKTVGTTYLADTDGIVCFYGGYVFGSSPFGATQFDGITDSGTSPTKILAQYICSHASDVTVDHVSSMTFPVKSGDYYNVTATALSGTIAPTQIMYFIPLGE